MTHTKRKRWSHRKTMIITLSILILLAGLGVLGLYLYTGYTLNHEFQPARDFKAALERCAHEPWAAVTTLTGELGSRDVDLIHLDPSRASWLTYSGYYCSQRDAQRSGLNVYNVNGISVTPTPSNPPQWR